MKRLLAAVGVAALAAMVLLPSTVGATSNKGTLKVHEAGTPSGTESNDPKVCVFNFEGFNFEEGENPDYIVIEGQGQTNGSLGPIQVGPPNADGYFASAYINGDNDLQLPNGHWKATLYGDEGLEEEKAKSKVFKVECETEPEIPNPPDLTVLGCEEVGGSGSLTVEGIEEGVTVRVNGPTNLSIDADGTFPIAPGHYGYRVVFDGEAIDSGTFDIEPCPPPTTQFTLPSITVECGGSITVTNFAAGNLDSVLIQPGDVVIDGDGVTELAPGEYTAVGIVDSEVVTDEFAFTIEACNIDEPPPPVDTGGGPDAPRSTLPPTDTAPAASTTVDLLANPFIFVGIVLISIGVIATIWPKKRRA